MDVNEYQALASRTLLAQPDHVPTEEEYMILWNALGLVGEAGELANHCKKGICHQHGLDRDELIKELGDVLWYVAALCTKLDVSMSEVASLNIAKLRKRYPDGYSSADSKTRADVA